VPMLKLMALALSLSSITGWADAQSTAARTFEHFAVTIGPQEASEGTWFRIDWNNGHVATVLVPDVFGPSALARDLKAYGTRRLIIQFGHTVVLVDPASGSVVDRFGVLRSAPSPAARYLAIQRHTPNGVSFVDAVYSIYDLEGNPTENRPQGANDAGAGVIVYPIANVAAQEYSVATHANHAHDLLSPLIWTSPHLLAFVDHHAGLATMVLVDVEPGVTQFKRTETVLDAADFLKPSTDVAQLRFLRVKNIEPLSITGSAMSLELTFQRSWMRRLLELAVRAARPQ
jgi:hypothetical protein